MKIWNLYNKLDDEQKTYLNSMLIVHEIEFMLKDNIEFTQEDKEDIFEIVHEAWISDGSNTLGGSNIANSVVSAIIDSGLTIKKLKEMSDDEVLDIVQFGYENEEELEV